MWRKDKPYRLLVGKHIDTITVKISMDVSQKTKILLQQKYSSSFSRKDHYDILGLRNETRL